MCILQSLAVNKLDRILHDRLLMPILWTFCTDDRCDVHQCLLAVRESKHGWFDLFCPGTVACVDDGQLYSAMVYR